MLDPPPFWADDTVNVHYPVLDILTKPVPIELDVQIESPPQISAQ